MDAVEFGVKHLCTECATKYDDMKNKIVACPRCGAKTPSAKSSPKVKKVSRAKFGRFL